MEWISYALLIIPLAITPGIALAILVYFHDKYEKEPFRLLRNSFLFGMLSVVPAVIVELLEGAVGFNENGHIIKTFFYAMIGVGLVEELSKYFFVRVYAYSKAAFNEPFDGIVYSVMVAMGFATAENILYSISHDTGTMVLRMFTAVPLHATCGVIMGFFMGLAKFRARPITYIFIGLLLATLAHGAYDFFLFQQDYPLLTVLAFVSLAISIVFSYLAIRGARKRSPFIHGSSIEKTTEGVNGNRTDNHNS